MSELEVLKWQIRSNPSWTHEDLIRDYLISDETKKRISELILQARAEVDQKSVDALLEALGDSR